jgi:serine/threonine protein kinase
MPVQLPALPATCGYQLQSLIGSGSSGEVWRASDNNQPAAVKFLKESLLTSPQRDRHLRRFQTEILCLQRLSGTPGIPRLIAYELDTERPYLIMEFIAGETFAALLESGTMSQIPLRQRLDLLQAIATALDAVHQAGLLHRDIKPANLRGTQPAYLLDFSVALDSASMDDDRAALVGTRLYRPPQPCDLAAPFRDRFAFAVVCYEVLFGRHPFFMRHEVVSHASDLETVAHERLVQHTWYTPTRLQAGNLPPNLVGAHLDRLDAIFQQAFDGDYFSAAGEFTTALRAAIDVPENQAVMDVLPSVTNPQHIASDYTDAEVQLPVLQTETGISQRPGCWLMPALLLTVLIILMMIATENSTGYKFVVM